MTEKNIYNFRFAKSKDAARLLDIYSYYVKETPVSFEYEVPQPAEFADRIEHIGASYPYLVCESDGIIIGYAYAAEFKPRIAYRWDVEMTVYIDRQYHRSHIGSVLYETVFEMLQLQGYFKAYALITTPNAESEGFHLKHGFTSVGVFRKTGYKLGAWRDVVFMEKEIAGRSDEPVPPISVGRVNCDQLKAILEKANRRKR